MTVSIDDEMLVEKYQRDRHEFARLVKVARCHAARGTNRTEADADEALDLLEALYAICAEQE